MANPKGNPNLPKGRKKGTKNKFTTLKQSFIDAFEATGGTEGLVEWGKKETNRAQFYQMITKLLPKAIEVEGEVDFKGIRVTFVQPSETD